MLLSVVTINFNGRAHLERCITSVRANLPADSEHLVVDCGSDDGSWALIDSLRHPRLRSEQRGVCDVVPARNHGWRQARGEFIAVMDADDIPLPGGWAAQLAELERNPAAQLVGGWIVRRAHDTNRTRLVKYPTAPDDIAAGVACGWNPVPHSTLVIRRSLLEALGGYDPFSAKGEDFNLLARAVQVGACVSVARPVAEYLFGRPASHSRRVRPQGRGESFYALGTLIRTGQCVDLTLAELEQCPPDVPRRILLQRCRRGFFHSLVRGRLRLAWCLARHTGELWRAP